MTEITYDQAADLLNCSPRNVRRVVRRNGIKPIRRGHRTVRLDGEKILRLKLSLVTHKARSNGHAKPRAAA